MQRLVGVGVSPGVVVGEALVLRRRALDFRFRVPPEAVEGELFRLSRARAHTLRQLKELRGRIDAAAGGDQALLLDAQVLMLEDPLLMERAAALIDKEHLDAEWAVQRASDELTARIRSVDDPYLRERHGDLADLIARLRTNLRGVQSELAQLVASARGPCLLVADDLPPSLTAQLDWTRVLGFATDVGSWTHHTAILARSLGIPAVVGLREASRRIGPGARVALDGRRGELLVDPSDEEIERWQRAESIALRVAADHAVETTVEPRTIDGHLVRIFGNVERPADTAAVRAMGAEGIGLVRSEFLMPGASGDEADEASQYAAYRQVLESANGAEVTVRTFDLAGGEAPAVTSRESTGLRGIRVSLMQERPRFKAQLRALLRASTAGRLRILLPFVSTIEDVRDARRLLDEARSEVAAEGTAIGDVPLGVMIEVPSAVAIADLLAREAEFFSIGTNDLVQYTLAVDRTDGRLAHLYEPCHPAILRLIRTTVRAARRRRRRASVCGEMAADPVSLALLLGLGVDEISVAGTAIRQARALVSRVNLSEVRRVAAHALRMDTADEIRSLVTAWLGSAHEVPSVVSGSRSQVGSWGEERT